jgi:hypothetical protein
VPTGARDEDIIKNRGSDPRVLLDGEMAQALVRGLCCFAGELMLSVDDWIDANP